MTGLPPLNTPPPLYNNLRGTNNEPSTSADIAAPPSYEEAINPNGMNNVCFLLLVEHCVLF